MTTIDLTSIFSYAGWSIKYTLLEPSNSSKETIQTIVFVHGTPWSSLVFHPLAKVLLAKTQSRILLYDLPGYGESQSYTAQHSDKPSHLFSGDTSISFQAKALAALLQHLSLVGTEIHPPPAVIAHDIAGTIVLRAHLLHGVDFSSMLLMDTNTVLPWGDGFYKLVRSNPEVFLQLPSGIFEAVVRAVTRSAVHNPGKLKSGWEEAIVKPWIEPTQGSELSKEDLQSNFVRQIAQANDDDVAEMLDAGMYCQVRCDVKILWGEEDQWIPRDKVDKLAAMLGERLKEFVVVPEAGHLVMIDQPERVAVEVLEWMSR